MNFISPTKNYLAMANTLRESFLANHSDVDFRIILVDEADGCLDEFAHKDHIIEAKHIGIPNWDSFKYWYDCMELNTAVKPFVFRKYLFEEKPSVTLSRYLVCIKISFVLSVP